LIHHEPDSIDSLLYGAWRYTTVTEPQIAAAVDWQQLTGQSTT